jgi:hypothetical protein
MAKSYQQTNTRDSFVRTAFLTLLYFLFLYAFQVPGLPFGTVIPVLGILAVYTACEFFKGNVRKGKTRTSKMLRTYWWWNVFLIAYVSIILLIYGRGNGTTPQKDYLQMMIILPLIFISGNLIFKDIKELMKILYIGVIIQSFIIIVALFIPALSLGLFLLIPEGSFNSDAYGGIDMIMQTGYHIGLGVFTSAGSLRMAIGQIGACYYLINSKGSKLITHLVLFFLITIATSVVSRTGLLISSVALLVFLFVKRKQGGSKALGYLFLVCFIPLIGYYIISSFISTDFLGETFRRLIDTADNGIHETYFRGYTGEGGDNTIPSISPETIIGLGITTGVSGSGITSITDGGFLRNYSAMGLVVAIINYIILSSFFLKQYKYSKVNEYKGIIFFMFCILLIGEFKEYYIYYVSPMCFFFLIFSLIEREENLSIRVDAHLVK